ncbi:hypothetical protein ANN_12695 [Periplaneta americana]|uniref:Uncharacterized protein n=1 Tax=Periplaneta americana TaxID=6978 RepID=A0ABQ8THV7_PERAM|nr:hypothetical protein ANN_12695 [Periplaneta americana]
MMWNFRVLFIRLSEDVGCVCRHMKAIFSNDYEHVHPAFAFRARMKAVNRIDVILSRKDDDIANKKEFGM